VAHQYTPEREGDAVMTRARVAHLRLVRPPVREQQAFSRPELARACAAVLAFAEHEKARYLEAVARLVAEKIEPIDAGEARIFLAELRSGALP
jgi:hypothetical protein